MAAVYATYQKNGSRNHRRTNKKSSKQKGYSHVLLYAALVLAVLFFVLTPKGTSAAAQTVPERSKYYTCITVESGDTLWDYAREFSTSEYADYYEYVDEVLEINHMPNSSIRSGMQLCIPYYADKPVA